MRLSVTLSCLVFMLAPLFSPAQGMEQSRVPATAETSSHDQLGDVVNILTILNRQIETLTSTVARIEDEVNVLKGGEGGLVSELAEADRLTAELQQDKELYRFIEIIVVALLGIVALYVILWYLRKSDEAKRNSNVNHKGLAPQDIMNVSGLSLIVFGTILVVIIADVDQQLTAAVGILGALAGYLFRGLHDEGHESKSPPEAPPSRSDEASR